MTVDETSSSATRAAHDLRVIYQQAAASTRRHHRRLPPDPVAASDPESDGKDGPASAADLAEAEQVRPQAITPILAALTAKHLIKKRPDPRDGRRILVSVTAAGQRLLDGTNHAADE